jgi:hypothetical protein
LKKLPIATLARLLTTLAVCLASSKLSTALLYFWFKLVFKNDSFALSFYSFAFGLNGL